MFVGGRQPPDLSPLCPRRRGLDDRTSGREAGISNGAAAQTREPRRHTRAPTQWHAGGSCEPGARGQALRGWRRGVISQRIASILAFVTGISIPRTERGWDIIEFLRRWHGDKRSAGYVAHKDRQSERLHYRLPNPAPEKTEKCPGAHTTSSFERLRTGFRVASTA